jgi:hypothetical protein
MIAARAAVSIALIAAATVLLVADHNTTSEALGSSVIGTVLGYWLAHIDVAKTGASLARDRDKPRGC